MKDNILYYAAGLIDGEGTITLGRQHARDKFRRPVISVSNTSQELLLFLKQYFGGCICKQKLQKSHYIPCRSWRICQNAATEFCSVILPYLKHPEKIRRAQLISSRYKQCTPRNGKYNDTILEMKLQFEYDFFHPSTTQ